MPQAKKRLHAWISAGTGSYGIDEVRESLDNDLDTPQAIAIIDQLAASGNGISEAAMLLGIDVASPYQVEGE